MSDFKDRMIQAEERGWPADYESVREWLADAADAARKIRREQGGEMSETPEMAEMRQQQGFRDSLVKKMEDEGLSADEAYEAVRKEIDDKAKEPKPRKRTRGVG